MAVRYRLVHMHSAEPFEAREKSIRPNDMRGVGKASFPRLASFLISLDKGGRGIGSPWLTPRTTTSGRARQLHSQQQSQQRSQLHSQHRGLPRRV